MPRRGGLDIEVPEEPIIVDEESIYSDITVEEEAMYSDTIDFNGKAVPLTESLEAVIENIQLKETDWEISEWEPNSNDAPMIDREAALKTALTEIQGMTYKQPSAAKINAVLVKFSGEFFKKIPGSDFSFIEIPVWLVTFEKIKIIRGRSISTDEPSTSLAVVHFIIDAYSGERLITSYSGVEE